MYGTLLIYQSSPIYIAGWPFSSLPLAALHIADTNQAEINNELVTLNKVSQTELPTRQPSM